jgi:hypothetical protein
MPIEKFENGEWPHVARLPLGCGWSGHCAAPGHENEAPSQQELRDFCNLGYAEKCSRFPQERIWDSVRFSARTVASGGNGSGDRIEVRYVCERAHRPADHGFLECDAVEGLWQKRHEDGRIQRMAECFLAAYVEKRKRCLQQAAS